MPAARRPSTPALLTPTLRGRHAGARPGVALVAAVVLAVAAGVTPTLPAAAAAPACGEFTGGAHVVTTAEHLAAIGSGVAGEDCDPARTYRLDNDISVASRETAVVTSTFTGTLEGNGRTITLAIDRTSDDAIEVGLFASLDGATITDLVLEGSVRTAGSGRVGALAARAGGTTTVTALSSFVVVTGRNDVGGLFGVAEPGSDLSLSVVQVGTPADPVEIGAVRHAGGLIGSAFGALTVGPGTVNVRVTPASTVGSDNNFLGGVVGYVFTGADLTVDGSASGSPHGLSVRFDLFAPGMDPSFVGGIVGSVSAGAVLIRGVALELDIDTAGTFVGGIAGSLVTASTRTIGGARAEDAVLVAGSIAAGPELGQRAGGISTFHVSEGDGTSVRRLTMDATVSGSEVGGLYSGVNGVLHVEDSVVSGPVEGVLSAGGIAASVSTATLTLRDVRISSDLRADQVGGIAVVGVSATMTLDDVQVSGRLRPRAATTDGFRGVAGLFLDLFEVAFTAPPTFSAADATIEADFPDGLAVEGAVLRAVGLVASLGLDIDITLLTGAAPTMVVTVSDAMRDSGRCFVASRFVRATGPALFERIDPLTPDPCPRGSGDTLAGDDDADDDVTASAGSTGGTEDALGDGPELACTWPRLVVGAQVRCTVSGGPGDAAIAWRALVNPTVAEGAVMLDGTGSGTFTFTIPRAAAGAPLSVELIEWRAPLLLGTVAAVLPTGIPAGEGPAARDGGGLAGLLVAALGLSAAMARVRRRRDVGATSGGNPPIGAAGLR